MKLLTVLFISSMLVLSIGFTSQDASDVAELVKEVQLLREQVDLLICHNHDENWDMGYQGNTSFPKTRLRDTMHFHDLGYPNQVNCLRR